ncbi:Pyruvate phosphate dikinase, PEP/pyruvate-binding domain protein [Candidatus Omnitrophus magneticus]|uniref:Pyruvate phosphate dikinase, PEP/pyruvate-binding domain protein n=1 Tax=Candidatus Omnitrophus magneticus TaxID=1609969 RepID=A0A0F0CU36_9BACT|nr:Pyruvate phosphate dikinase, PEP/pyruvate-binding domain protein [Candidatus Omnitrophus magneticus]
MKQFRCIFIIALILTALGYCAGLKYFFSTDRAEGILNVLDIQNFDLPEYLGDIKYRYKGGPDKLIIHVQDAHTNYECQKKINDIIDRCVRHYGIDLINLEGGAGSYNLDVFKEVKNKDIRMDIADYFLRNGEMNGAEVFAVHNMGEVTLWGIEDKELYLKNLKVFRDSLTFKKEAKKYIGQLSEALSEIKRVVYSKELIGADKIFEGYKNQDIEFLEYLKFLLKISKEKGVDKKYFVNVDILEQSLLKEKTIDFDRADKDAKIIAEELEKKFSKYEKNKFIEKTLDYKADRISRKDYYEYLVSSAKAINFNIKNYINLKQYIEYVSLYEKVDHAQTAEELSRLEDMVKEKLFREPREREIDDLSNRVGIIKNIFDFSLTVSQYKSYLSKRPDFSIKFFIDIINRFSSAHNLKINLDKNIGNLDIYRERIEDFFKISFARDSAFLSNLRFTELSNGSSAAIMMTGGFHTDNLLKLFESNGISYVSIMPRFRSGKEETHYFKFLAGGMPDIITKFNSLLVSTSMIQIASKFNALGESVWGAGVIQAGKAAIEALDKLIQEEILKAGEAKGHKVIENIKSVGNINLVDGKVNVSFKMSDGSIKTILYESAFLHEKKNNVESVFKGESFDFYTSNDTSPTFLTMEQIGEKLKAAAGDVFSFVICEIIGKDNSKTIKIAMGPSTVFHSVLMKNIQQSPLYESAGASNVKWIHGTLSGANPNFNFQFKDKNAPTEEENASKVRMESAFQNLMDSINTGAVRIENPSKSVIFQDRITGEVIEYAPAKEGAMHSNIIRALNVEFAEGIKSLYKGNAPQVGSILDIINNKSNGSLYKIENGAVTVNTKYKNKIQKISEQLALLELVSKKNEDNIGFEDGLKSIFYDYSADNVDFFTVVRGAEKFSGKNIAITQFESSKDFELFAMANSDLYKALKNAYGSNVISKFYAGDKGLSYFKDVDVLDSNMDIVDITNKDELNKLVKGSERFLGALGGKGAGLLDMKHQKGLPVPDAFIITTNAFRKWYKVWNERFSEEVEKREKKQGMALSEQEKEEIQKNMPLLLNDSDELKDLKNSILEFFKKLREQNNSRPVSVRSGAPLSMPGAMDTILDIYDEKSLISAVEAVFRSWDSIDAKSGRRTSGFLVPDNLGTAVNIQIMRYASVPKYTKDVRNEKGNIIHEAGDVKQDVIDYLSKQSGLEIDTKNSFSGILNTRNSTSGENVFEANWARSLGEELVSGLEEGKNWNDLEKDFGEIAGELSKYAKVLEEYYGFPQDIEFTVENGKLYILQTRNMQVDGDMGIKFIRDLTLEKINKIKEDRAVSDAIKNEKIKILKEKAYETAKPYLETFQKSSLKMPLKDSELYRQILLSQGKPASNGAVSGELVMSSNALRELRSREKMNDTADNPRPFILVMEETEKGDMSAIELASGVIFLSGGTTSHAANVARKLKKPAVVATDILVNKNGYLVKANESITISRESCADYDGLWGDLVKLGYLDSKGNVLGKAGLVKGYQEINWEEFTKKDYTELQKEDIYTRLIGARMNVFYSIDGKTGEIAKGREPIIFSKISQDDLSKINSYDSMISVIEKVAEEYAKKQKDIIKKEFTLKEVKEGIILSGIKELENRMEQLQDGDVLKFTIGDFRVGDTAVPYFNAGESSRDFSSLHAEGDETDGISHLAEGFIKRIGNETVIIFKPAEKFNSAGYLPVESYFALLKAGKDFKQMLERNSDFLNIFKGSKIISDVHDNISKAIEKYNKEYHSKFVLYGNSISKIMREKGIVSKINETNEIEQLKEIMKLELVVKAAEINELYIFMNSNVGETSRYKDNEIYDYEYRTSTEREKIEKKKGKKPRPATPENITRDERNINEYKINNLKENDSLNFVIGFDSLRLKMWRFMPRFILAESKMDDHGSGLFMKEFTPENGKTGVICNGKISIIDGKKQISFEVMNDVQAGSEKEEIPSSQKVVYLAKGIKFFLEMLESNTDLLRGFYGYEINNPFLNLEALIKNYNLKDAEGRYLTPAQVKEEILKEDERIKNMPSATKKPGLDLSSRRDFAGITEEDFNKIVNLKEINNELYLRVSLANAMELNKNDYKANKEDAEFGNEIIFNIKDNEGFVKIAKDIGIREVSMDIFGRSVNLYLSSELEIAPDTIKDLMEQAIKDARGNIDNIPKNLVIGLVDESYSLFVDRASHGFIGINKILIDRFKGDNEKNARNIIIKIGLSRFISKALTGENGITPEFQSEQNKRDIDFAVKSFAGQDKETRNAFNKFFTDNVLRSVFPELVNSRLIEMSKDKVSDVAKSCRDVLSLVRPNNAPTYIFVEADTNDELFNGAEYVKVNNKTARYISREYGANLKIYFLSVHEMNKKIEDVTSRKNFKENDNARILVFANSEVDIDGRISREFNERMEKYKTLAGEVARERETVSKMAAMVPGNFLTENMNNKFSIVALSSLGIGIADFSRMSESERNGELGSVMGKEIQSLFLQLVESPSSFNSYDTKKLLDALIKGNIFMKIQRINYGEIKEYIQAEAAVLESL